MIHDHCNFAYPTEADSCDAARNLLDYESGCPDMTEVCARHCRWVFQGYLLSKDCDPEPNPCDEAAKKDAVAKMKSRHLGGVNAAQLATFDWSSIIAIFLAILESLRKPVPATHSQPAHPPAQPQRGK